MVLEWLSSLDVADAPHVDPLAHFLGHLEIGHGASSGSDFLMLGQTDEHLSHHVHHDHPTSMLEVLPRRYARKLATKAVNKAAWLHDAVVDFQETELFWQAHRFARRHVVAEAFGLGAVTGGLLLLTAPSPSPRPKAPEEKDQHTLQRKVRPHVRAALPTLPVVDEEVESEMTSEGGGELDDSGAEDEPY
ncbi:unnamed protein product [Durusdinium trenchii]|uniref:Uncharacterized protein n=1 Tax=Durusdinium trenchii TaxID=1381693 RepID=A0ABP0PJQ7_9DINO